MNEVGYTVIRDPEALDRTFNAAMTRVYLWMATGLALTAGVAAAVAQSTLADAVSGNWWVLIGLFVVQMAMVGGISGAINKLDPGTTLGLFYLFSGVMGVTLSIILGVFNMGTIGIALTGTTATFGAMSLVGLTTKKDLTGFGPILMASLFGIIAGSMANWFFQSGALEWVISIVGVVIFMGLTAHDSQMIKEMTSEAVANDDDMAARRIGVWGALLLYLNFMNLFLFILNLLGGDD